MKRIVSSWSAVLFATAAGCMGAIQEGGSEPSSPSTVTVPPKPPVDVPVAACNGAPPATPRLARLTRLQYENSLRDLTGLDVRTARDLPEDPVFAGFDRGLDLEVGEVVSRVYRDQAEAVARQVVATPAAFARVVGCNPTGGDACMNSFVSEFGKRVFRRPLSDAERTRYVGLFKSGATLVESGEPFVRGVQLTLEAMFQSPNFLYRVEASNGREGQLVPLSSFEVATRLSFTLANTTPDEMLLRAADRNELRDPAQVAQHARRLLSSTTGRATMRDFHHQWMGVEDWASHLDKDPAKHPSVTPALASQLGKELDLFVEAVTFEQKKGLATLLTAPFAYANRVTAPLYGVKGVFDAEPRRIDLDPNQRAGLLTQIGFLASHALSNQSSPIHRGVFVLRRVLCTAIPDPTEQVPALPPPAAGRTTREIVQEHTSPDGCKGCHHSLINPVGFAFENYDAAGQWRTSDNGKPVDASGTLPAVAKPVAFNNAVELAKALADSTEARSCYARQWWRYAFGRHETETDRCSLDALGQALSNDAYTPVDLLVDLVRTKAFMYRSWEGQ